MSNFEARFAAAVDQVISSMASNKLSSTVNSHFVYLSSIYKNLNDNKCPHQLVGEIALSMMLSNDLRIARGWKLIRSPLGEYVDVQGGNWWILHKGQSKLEIILGDPYHGTDPDLVVTDHVQFEQAATLFNLGPEIFGLHENSVEFQYQNRMPTRLFNCFMSGANVSRQYCFYQLVRKNLIKDGAVSYLVNDQKDPENSNDSRLKRYHKIKQDPLVEIFDHEHNFMAGRIPFKNFESSLEQAIIDSKISLVVETSSDSGQGIFLTEKTFRSLMMPRPFYLYVTGYKTGAVESLRRIGFDVYDDIVDHSYDSIVCSTQRLLAILEQIEKFRQFEYTPKILLDFESRARYNLQLIKQLRANLPQKYQTVISQLKAIT